MFQVLHKQFSAARSKIQHSIAMFILFEIPQRCSNFLWVIVKTGRGAPTNCHHKPGKVSLSKPNEPLEVDDVKGDFSSYLIVATPVQYSNTVWKSGCNDHVVVCNAP